MTRIFLLLFFLLPLSSFSQEEWSIEKCVRYALEHNLNLKQSSLNTGRAEIQLEQNRLGRYPSVNGSASHNYFFGRTVDPTEYTFSNENIRTNSVGINADLNLFSGFQNQRRIEQSELELAANLKEQEVAQNNLVLTVLLTYLQVLNSQEQINVLENQSEITRSQLDRLSKLLDAGMIAEGDIWQVEVQERNDELALVNARNAHAIAYLDLAQAMDYNDELSVEVPSVSVEDLPSAQLFDVQKIFDESEANWPAMQASALRVQASEKGLDVARAALYPRLSLGAGGTSNFSSRFQAPVPGTEGFREQVLGIEPMTGQEISILVPTIETAQLPFFDQLEQNLNWNAGLRLTIPIFNQLQARKGIELAQLGIESNRLIKQNTSNQLFKEIQQAVFAAQSAESNYYASVKAAEAAEKALDNIEKRFELGIANSFDFATAKNNLTTAELRVNSAKFDYIFRMKVIDYYLGKEITL